MALSREITLTIDNYNITLDKEIKIYEYDAINLCFTIQECGIVMRDGKAHNRIMPVVALKAYMLIETPQGTDSVEATNVVRNKIMFSLGNKYSRFVGTGKMQIILKDFDGCRITLPEFNYEVKQSINTGWDDGSFDVLITEKEDIVITDELGRPVETTKISEFDETNEITPQTYTMVINEDGNKKIKLDTMMESISEMIEFDVEEIDRKIDEMIEVYDDEEVEVEFPSLHNDVERIKDEINEISESLDNMKNAKDIEKINAKYPPQGYKGIEENEDITEVLNILLNNFSHVFIPNGNYILNGTINVPNDTHLEMGLNTKIKVINNLPVIQLNNRTKVYGGFIDIPSNHNAGVIYLTGISTYNDVSNIKMVQNTAGNPNPEIGTAIGIYFDGRKEEYDIKNCYQMFNNFDKIQIDWCGYVVKHAINSKPYSTAPWCTANNFTNITAWHTHQIVDVACSFGGNIFNNIITQCGIYDTLLYRIEGSINHFTNLIYYDLPSNCTIVEMTENSRLNLFHLWFENEGGFKAKYINNGNKNTITKLGGFLESPIDLVMENGWQHKNDSDANVQKAQCYKNNLKEVKLRGRVVGGSANQVIATLPVGYRPPKHTFFAVPTSDRTVGVITILYTGAIIAYGQEKMDFTLDGISFRVDV